MQFDLSICIPTYNREKYLKVAIDSILSQINNENINSIEICISDNASEDNTKELAEGYIKTFPHITYFRWDKNMGPDKNFMKSVEIASGKYCWLLGSDDILEQNALKTMLEEIKNTADIDIFCVNNLIYDINLENPSIAKHNMWNEKKDILFNNYRNCIKKMGAMFGYLSAFIFKREKWDKYAGQGKYIGSAYPHMYVLYSIMKDNGILKYIARPLVGYRGENDFFMSDGIFNRALIDVTGYNNIAADVFGENSKEQKKINELVLCGHVYNRVRDAVMKGQASLKYRCAFLKLTLKYYHGYASYWIRVFPWLITPLFVIKIIRFFYRITIKQFKKKK